MIKEIQPGPGPSQEGPREGESWPLFATSKHRGGRHVRRSPRPFVCGLVCVDVLLIIVSLIYVSLRVNVCIMRQENWVELTFYASGGDVVVFGDFCCHGRYVCALGQEGSLSCYRMFLLVC